MYMSNEEFMIKDKSGKLVFNETDDLDFERVEFSISTPQHSEAFTEPGSNFHVILKPVKPYGTGAHVLVPVQHAGKRCVIVVLED